MDYTAEHSLVSLDVDHPFWDRFFTVAPLVMIGTREGSSFNLAPKHMVTPMGWRNYFGFVCTPRHSTYHNVKHHGVFTVSYVRPTQVVLAGLAAGTRVNRAGEKPALANLPTFPAELVDGILVQDAYLFLECELEQILDGFGENSLIIGRVVATHVSEDALRISERDDQKLLFESPVLAYLNPQRYAVIKKSFAFPMPAHYNR